MSKIKKKQLIRRPEMHVENKKTTTYKTSLGMSYVEWVLDAEEDTSSKIERYFNILCGTQEIYGTLRNFHFFFALYY